MKKILLLLVILILVSTGYFIFSKNKSDYLPVACTMEAKMCPDGSYVGRTLPNCDFAMCPEMKAIVKVKLNQTISSEGVQITPLKLISDSRCPSEVTCIWAGNVIVKVKFISDTEEEEKDIITNKPISFAGKVIELKNVTPTASLDKKIKTGEYVFEFLIK